MKILNTLNLGGLGATDSLVLNQFPDGKQCLGLRLRFAIPCTMTAHTGNTAGLVALLAHFQAFTLSYGEGQSHTVLPQVPGDELRDLYRFVNQDEVQNSHVGTVYSAGAATVYINLFIPFVLDMWKGRQRLPGTSQMRTMKLELIEGASGTVNANISRAAGNVTVDVVPVYIDGQDQWVSPLSFFRINSPRLDAESPDGIIVGAWDANAASAASALTRFSNRIGENLVDENIYLALVRDEYARQIDALGSDVNDSVTLLFAQPRWMDLDSLPGGRFGFKQNSQDLATIKLRGAYFPAMSEVEGQEAAKVAAKRTNNVVLATQTDAPAWAHPSASAWSPVKLATPKESDFVTRAGVLAEPGGKAEVSVPPVVGQAVAAARLMAPDRVTAQQVSARATKNVVRQIPGAVATSGQGQGSGRQVVHTKIGVLAK